MKSNLFVKILLMTFISTAFTAQLMGQMPDKDIAGFSKKKKNVLNKAILKTKAYKPITHLDTSENTDNKLLINQLAYFFDLRKYVRSHLVYPELARDYAVEGLVLAEVEINSLGDIMSVNIIQGLGFGCDEAVIDLLCKMPRWQPCLKKGIPQSQIVSIPVKFSLM
jgi:Na+-translocating ferredoxin:NAD+ oxidoreductase RnfG subunit